MLQIVTLLTYDSRGMIYDCNTFILQATDVELNNVFAFIESFLQTSHKLFMNFLHASYKLLKNMKLLQTCNEYESVTNF
jgi:hypothetical protein